MNNELYNEVEMEVVQFEEADIIVTSGASDEPVTSDYETPIG